MIGKIWRSPISLGKRVDATLHLISGMGYVSTILLSILAIPVLWLAKEHFGGIAIWLSVCFIAVNSFLVWSYYFVATLEVKGLCKRTFVDPLLLLIFSIGLSINGTVAVIDALIGKKTPFIRTPKFNGRRAKRQKGKRRIEKTHWLAFFLVAYFLVMFGSLAVNAAFYLIPAALFFSFGHFWIFFRGWRERTAG